MVRRVRLTCDDAQRVELLLAVAKEMGIEVSADTKWETMAREPELTYGQKQELDHRRSTSKEEDFIPWDEAKKVLRLGKK